MKKIYINNLKKGLTFLNLCGILYSVKGKDKIKEQLPAKTTAQELKTQNDLKLNFILSNPEIKINIWE